MQSERHSLMVEHQAAVTVEEAFTVRLSDVLQVDQKGIVVVVRQIRREPSQGHVAEATHSGKHDDGREPARVVVEEPDQH